MDGDFPDMITVNAAFDKVIWIGSVNRPDRAAQMEAQFAKFGIVAERFEAHWKPLDHTWKPNGNLGCTSSHRGVLELIAHHGWERTLVLEDDAMFLGDDFPEQFDAMIQEVPLDWDLLFLGAGYAERPKRRINGSVIQTNALMTTSSYGITRAMARKMAPYISGIGPIDSLFHEWQRTHKCYIFSPRLAVQRPSFSDLQEKESENMTSMQDTRHEEMLLDGAWREDGAFVGQLNRRELSSAEQLVGEEVIIDGKLFVIRRVELPAHRMPWFAGEPVTYFVDAIRTE